MFHISDIELLITFVIIIGDLPSKPKCIKYLLRNNEWIKWLLLLLLFSQRSKSFIKLLYIIVIYKLLYIVDEKIYTHYHLD
jgi:hypothetical protein